MAAGFQSILGSWMPWGIGVPGSDIIIKGDTVGLDINSLKGSLSYASVIKCEATPLIVTPIHGKLSSGFVYQAGFQSILGSWMPWGIGGISPTINGKPSGIEVYSLSGSLVLDTIINSTPASIDVNTNLGLLNYEYRLSSEAPHIVVIGWQGQIVYSSDVIINGKFRDTLVESLKGTLVSTSTIKTTAIDINVNTLQGKLLSGQTIPGITGILNVQTSKGTLVVNTILGGTANIDVNPCTGHIKAYTIIKGNTASVQVGSPLGRLYTGITLYLTPAKIEYATPNGLVVANTVLSGNIASIDIKSLTGNYYVPVSIKAPAMYIILQPTPTINIKL